MTALCLCGHAAADHVLELEQRRECQECACLQYRAPHDLRAQIDELERDERTLRRCGTACALAAAEAAHRERQRLELALAAAEVA